jgi:hypothetical protein
MSSRQEWLRHLEAAASSDPKRSTPSVTWIENRIRASDMDSLSSLVGIVLSRSPASIRHKASEFALSCFLPGADVALERLRRAYRLPPPVASDTLTTLYKAVFGDDDVVSTACAQSLATIPALDPLQIRTFLNNLAADLNGIPPVHQALLLSVFRLLISYFPEGEIRLPDILPGCRRFFFAAQSLFASPDLEICRVASGSIIVSLSVIPNLVATPQEALALIQSVHHFLARKDPAGIEAGYDVLFQLVITCYSDVARAGIMRAIWDLSSAAIESGADFEQRGAFAFWERLADWERVELPTFGVKSQQLSETVAPALLPGVFRRICAIPPEAIALDWVESGEVLAAVQTLVALFRVAPATVFDGFILGTFRASIGAAEWEHRHAALALLFAVSEGPTLPRVLPFIRDAMPALLAHCIAAENQRLQVTALSCLARIIAHFPQMFMSQEWFGDLGAVFDRILAAISNGPHWSRSMIESYIDVFSALARVSGGPLSSKFGMMAVFVSQILCAEFEQEIDQESVGRAVAAINLLIVNAKLEEHMDEACLLLESFVRELVWGIREVEERPDRFDAKSRLCPLVAALCSRVGNQISEPLRDGCITLCNAMLAFPQSWSYDWVIVGVAAFYGAMRQWFTDEQRRAFFSRIHGALNSWSIDVINTGSYLLGCAFRAEPVFPLKFIWFFSLLGSLLEKPAVEPAYPGLLRAFGGLLAKLRSALPMSGIAPIVKRGICPALKFPNIDPTNRDDVFWANDLFAGMMIFQLSYIPITYPVVRSGSAISLRGLRDERNLLLHMSRLASEVLKLPFVRDELLEQFCALARQTAQSCSRRNNVVLNLPPIHNLLALCSAAARPDRVRELGASTAQFLKGR